MNDAEKSAFVSAGVAGDTWVTTTQGARQVADLVGQRVMLLVNGKPSNVIADGFVSAGVQRTSVLETSEGYVVRLSAPCKVLTKSGKWLNVETIGTGQPVMLHQHHDAKWDGPGTFDEGYIVGHFLGDGTRTGGSHVLETWGDTPGVTSVQDTIMRIMSCYKHRSDWNGWNSVARLAGSQGGHRLASQHITLLLADWGMVQHKSITALAEMASSDFTCGMLRGLFDTDGHVEGSSDKGMRVVLTQANREFLVVAQRLLGRLGVLSKIYLTHAAGPVRMPDGRGGRAMYDRKAVWRLVVSGAQASAFMCRIGFEDTDKTAKWVAGTSAMTRGFYLKPTVAISMAPTEGLIEEVFSISAPFDGNGMCLTAIGRPARTK